jgi:tetrahydromethanopterin S-methyltransferase subunit G
MAPTLKVINADEECSAHGAVVRRLDSLEEWRLEMERERREDMRDNQRVLGEIHEKVNGVASTVAGIAGAAKGRKEVNALWFAILGLILVVTQVGAMFLMRGTP